MEAFKTQLYWLKREDSDTMEILVDDTDIPHEFLCPITHEIMKEPVRCSGKGTISSDHVHKSSGIVCDYSSFPDGFTYERAAINEWFLCGKFTSPMTNESLRDASFLPNILLRNAIRAFLHGDRPQS